MLKTVAVSANGKTGPIAVTYRSGQHEVYGTCPKSCRLNPRGEHATSLVDREYLQAVYDAVPRDGIAWTYSHFDSVALPKPKPGKTTINFSADSVADAVRSVELGHPTVYAAPVSAADKLPATIHGIRFVRCPAELADGFTCQQCGNGSPLCARGERDFVVVFVAHGTGKKRVGSDAGGGCYAANGPTAIQWRNTKKNGAANDAEALRAFARSLPRRAMLRHHIAGDIGAEAGAC